MLRILAFETWISSLVALNEQTLSRMRLLECSQKSTLSRFTMRHDLIFQAAEKHGAAIPATPISSTLKRVTGDCIVETVPREKLFAAQTPQVFRRELILEAYAQRGNFEATDEASLVERLGHAVHVVKGSPMNIKITTQEDLKIAGALLSILPREKGLDAIAPSKNDGLDWLLAGK
jgi:2-C-methyl-D-erythritol 4-phosphate cytidylyltransferase